MTEKHRNLKLCEHRWTMSRSETQTLPARHVCWLKFGHVVDHQCGCGAILDVRDEEATDTDDSPAHPVNVSVPDPYEQRYFLKADWSPWIEVNKTAWLDAERHAGFRNKSGNPHEPATGGFSGNGVQGRLVYTTTDPRNYDWDKEFKAVAWPVEEA